uniref:Heterokaryon incompatibility domain-containing protein n=1 Tax=Bionectria ochroleuca TaxID=29856 RepID=A0A0B7KB35_BIOOC
MSFQYMPLPGDQEGSIRLINLLPKKEHPKSCEGPDNSDAMTPSPRVHCTLSVARLEEPPPYAALSYTWGILDRKRTIMVNGMPFLATENLESALYHLTPHDYPLVLWVDVICIDQNNEGERPQQLQKMRQIYSRATSVTAWLGPPRDNSDIALGWIQYYGSLADSLGIGTRPDLMLLSLLQSLRLSPGKLPENNRLKTFLKEISKEVTSDSGQAESIRVSLAKLFDRPYWSRVWAVQEMAHAKSVRFACGDKSVSVDALHHALRLVRNLRQFQKLRQGCCVQQATVKSIGFPTNTRNAISLLKIQRAAEPLPLIYLLRIFFKASDPRDRLLALLGFASDADILGLSSDFQDKSYEELYCDVVLGLITNGFFDVLSLCDPDNRISGYPSWTPDFTKLRARVPLQQRALDRHSSLVKTSLRPTLPASGKRKLGSKGCPLPVSSGSHLVLHAKLIDIVDQVGTQWKAGYSCRWLEELRQFYFPNGAKSLDPLPPTCLQAVLRTAVADQEGWRAAVKPRLSDSMVAKVQEVLEKSDLPDDTATLTSFGVDDYMDQLQDIAKYRCPFRTSTGRIGIGPHQMKSGDRIHVLAGASVPYAMREGTDRKLRLLGEVYLHGIMDGEALDNVKSLDKIKLY